MRPNQMKVVAFSIANSNLPILLPHGGVVAFSLAKNSYFLSIIYMAALPYILCANKKTEEIVVAKNKHLSDARFNIILPGKNQLSYPRR